MSKRDFPINKQHGDRDEWMAMQGHQQDLAHALHNMDKTL